MKIGYVTPPPTISGGIRIICEHVWRLNRAGHDARLIAVNNQSPDWFPHKLPQIRLRDALASPWDVLVATGIGTPNLVCYGGKYARVRAYFVQMMEHEFYPPSNKEIREEIKDTYRLPLKVLTISEWLRSRLQGFGHKDVPVIRNGVNTDMFYPDHNGSDDGKFRVLVEMSSGNHAKDPKGIIRKVLPLLKDADVTLLTYNLEIGRLWREHGWCNRVVATDDQAVVRRTYSNADVLVKVSRLEGRPCVHVEAMACGTPVVCALDKGRDDLYNGANCLLCDYKDGSKLRRNLKKVMEDRYLRSELRNNGLTYVKKHLNWDDIIPQLVGVYEKMLEAA